MGLLDSILSAASGKGDSSGGANALIGFLVRVSKEPLARLHVIAEKSNRLRVTHIGRSGFSR